MNYHALDTSRRYGSLNNFCVSVICPAAALSGDIELKLGFHFAVAKFLRADRLATRK